MRKTFPPGTPKAEIDAFLDQARPERREPVPGRCLGELQGNGAQPDIGATFAAAIGHALTLGMFLGERSQPAPPPRTRGPRERDFRVIGPC